MFPDVSESKRTHTCCGVPNLLVRAAGIIFPGEASFTYVEQARTNPKNPRVYLLKFAGSDEKLFFWMQV